MASTALSTLRPAVASTVLLTAICGLAYPLAVTGIATLVFPRQAAGSLVHDSKGGVVGSSLIAQGFAKPEYLHPRPSAAGNGYDPTNSGGSNLGPLDNKLIDRVAKDAESLAKENGVLVGALPVDAVTTSASGLDPDISPAYARLQAARIATARGVAPARVLRIIDSQEEGRALGFLGEPRVNVLAVNRTLDARLPAAMAR